MVLAPNDFYAYSQATGTQYPESAEDRALIAPEVRRFRQNQLRAPVQEQSGPDLSDIAMGAGLFGMALATGIGAAQGFRGRGRSPVARPRSGNEGIVQGEANVRKIAEQAKPSSRENYIDRALDMTRPKYMTKDDLEKVKGELKKKDLKALKNIQQELKGRDQWVIKGEQATVAPSKTVGLTADRIQQEKDELAIRKYRQKLGQDIGQKVAADRRNQRLALAELELDELTAEANLGSDIVTDPITGRKKLVTDLDVILDEIRSDNEIRKGDPAPRMQDRIRQAALNQINPPSTNLPPSQIPLLNKLKTEKIAKLKALKKTADESSMGVVPIDVNVPPVTAQETLKKTVLKLQAKPAPISGAYQQKLFTNEGLLKSQVITQNLADENIIPKSIAQRLSDSSILVSSDPKRPGMGNVVEYTDLEAVQDATKHVSNLLKEDYQDSIKNYMLTGGELQDPGTKGIGYLSTEDKLKTQVVGQGASGVKVSQPKASARYARSDIEAMYRDPATGQLIPQSEISSTLGDKGETGIGIGSEGSEIVTFAKREPVRPFLKDATGEIAEGKARYKGQGTGYAIGGAKELGKGNEFDYKLELAPVFKTDTEAMQSGLVSYNRAGKLQAKVEYASLPSNPGGMARLTTSYGNVFHENPATGKPWATPAEATNFINQYHENYNQKTLLPQMAEVDSIRAAGLPFKVNLTGKSEGGLLPLEQGQIGPQRLLGRGQRTTILNPNEVREVVATSSGEKQITLATQMQEKLLKKGSLVEEQIIDEKGKEGATYLTQPKYEVGEEGKMRVLGLGDEGIYKRAKRGEDGQYSETARKNYYTYLRDVNDSYQELTGNRLADLDLALQYKATPGGEYMGGPGKNPYLNKALVIADTLTQASNNATRIKMDPTDKDVTQRVGIRGPARRDRTLQRKDSEIKSSASQQLANTPQKVLEAAQDTMRILEKAKAQGTPASKEQFKNLLTNISNSELYANSPEVTPRAIGNTIKLRSTLLKESKVTNELRNLRSQIGSTKVPATEQEIAQTVAEFDYDLGSTMQQLQAQAGRRQGKKGKKRR